MTDREISLLRAFIWLEEKGKDTIFYSGNNYDAAKRLAELGLIKVKSLTNFIDHASFSGFIIQKGNVSINELKFLLNLVD